MKTQNPLLLILFACWLNACLEPTPAAMPYAAEREASLAVYGVDPNSAKCGTEVTLYGENFEMLPSANFVTFDPWGLEPHTGRIAKVTHAPHSGMVRVTIPKDLPAGNYAISVTARGQSQRCTIPFTIKADG